MRQATLNYTGVADGRRKKPGSFFVDFFVTSVALILMLSCTFTFVIFKTDGFLVQENNNGNYAVPQVNTYRATTIIDRVVNDNVNVPGAAISSSAAHPGVSVDLSITAQQVLTTLQSHPAYADKAQTLACIYQIIAIDSGMGSNLAIAIMANVLDEGNLGVVEHAFSKYHAHGFRLPSGGTTVQIWDDIEYLKNWNSTSTEKDSNGVKLGSCGFGSIQWSFSRRVNLCNIYMKYQAGSPTIDNNLHIMVEAEMIAMELNPSQSYYNTISSVVSSGASIEDWAEAVCDYYIKPGGWCGKENKMTGVGSACKSRRAHARALYDLLSSVL